MLNIGNFINNRFNIKTNNTTQAKSPAFISKPIVDTVSFTSTPEPQLNTHSVKELAGLLQFKKNKQIQFDVVKPNNIAIYHIMQKKDVMNIRSHSLMPSGVYENVTIKINTINNKILSAQTTYTMPMSGEKTIDMDSRKAILRTNEAVYEALLFLKTFNNNNNHIQDSNNSLLNSKLIEKMDSVLKKEDKESIKYEDLSTGTQYFVHKECDDIIALRSKKENFAGEEEFLICIDISDEDPILFCADSIINDEEKTVNEEVAAKMVNEVFTKILASKSEFQIPNSNNTQLLLPAPADKVASSATNNVIINSVFVDILDNLLKNKVFLSEESQHGEVKYKAIKYTDNQIELEKEEAFCSGKKKYEITIQKNQDGNYSIIDAISFYKDGDGYERKMPFNNKEEMANSILNHFIIEQ